MGSFFQQIISAFGIAATMLFQLPALSDQGGQQPSSAETASTTADEIDSLIRKLGDPSYEKRTAATRRLCALGPAAAARLRKAARGDDAEIALRAGIILEILDRLDFTGVAVHLQFTQSEIRWDEPVDLQITFTNRGEHRASVPFELDDDQRQRLSNDARQVGDMLDAAELLRMLHEANGPIDLRVDDINADAAVNEQVSDRLEGGPRSIIRPGQSATLVLQMFNRGWARYPLLDAGRYRVQLEYMPQWRDEVLAAERIGRVVSNEAVITVTRGAPSAVSRRGVEASVELNRKGEFLVAAMRNRSDLPLWINRNFGVSPPFAQGRWIAEFDGVRREIPIVPDPAASWHDFDPDLLVEVRPGETAELARIRTDELQEKLGPPTGEGSAWRIHFSYVNLCNRRWQAAEGPALMGNPGAPAIFQTTLPRRIDSAHRTSPMVSLPEP